MAGSKKRAWILPLAAAILTGCAGVGVPGVATPGDAPASEVPSAQAENTVEPDAPALTVSEPDWATLPEWIPADLPMPEGEFVQGSDYTCSDKFICDYGYSLMFFVESYEKADDLAKALRAYGQTETAVNEYYDGTRIVRFTEGMRVRANVVIDSPDWADWPVIEYNIEPAHT